MMSRETSKASGVTSGAELTSQRPNALGAEIRRPALRSGRLVLLSWFGPLLAFILVAVVGPILVPFNPLEVRLADRLVPPGGVLSSGATTIFGTDQVGKSMGAQLLQGARISFLVGVTTICIAGSVGLVIGVVSAYYGRFLDSLLMRLADIQLAFPSILLAILIAAVLGPSVPNVIITLSVTRWVTFARVARATTLMTKELEFVQAARAVGARDGHILLRHIIPSALPPFIVLAAAEMGLVILAEASLSFLGLGTPPEHPSWGLIIANGRDYLTTAWWISTLPGIALALLVLSLGLFGDALRDYLDPRAKRR